MKLKKKYEKMVAALIKPGPEILNSLTPGKVNAWHMATLISGEAGELLDAIKKWVVYGLPLDRDNVVEELGDLEFGLEGLRKAVGVKRKDTLKHNRDKLSERYPAGVFTKGHADLRLDKKES